MYFLKTKDQALYDPETHQVVQKLDVWFDEATNTSSVKVDLGEHMIFETTSESTDLQPYDSITVDKTVKNSNENDSSEYKSLDEVISEEEQIVAVGPGRAKIIRSGKPV